MQFRIFEDLRPDAIDRDNGILRNVRVCGLVSKNKRTYSEQALRNAIPLYEGCQVNIDHTRGNDSRAYGSRFGVLRGVQFVEANGLRGDLYFNPKHHLAEQVCFDAAHGAPIGLSHDVEARTVRGPNGETIVEEIARVRSVDIVANPATTQTLFEGTEGSRDSLSHLLDAPAPVESRLFAALQGVCEAGGAATGTADSLTGVFKS